MWGGNKLGLLGHVRCNVKGAKSAALLPYGNVRGAGKKKALQPISDINSAFYWEPELMPSSLHVINHTHTNANVKACYLK